MRAVGVVGHDDRGGDGDGGSGQVKSGGGLANAVVTAVRGLRTTVGRSGVESRDSRDGGNGGMRDVGGGQPGRVPGAGALMANGCGAGDERSDGGDDGGGVDLGGDNGSGTRGVLRGGRLVSWLVGRLSAGLVGWLVGGQSSRLVVTRKGGRLARGYIGTVRVGGRLVGWHMSRVGGTSGVRPVASSPARSDNNGRSGQAGSDVGVALVRPRLGDGASGHGGEGGQGLSAAVASGGGLGRRRDCAVARGRDEAAAGVAGARREMAAVRRARERSSGGARDGSTPRAVALPRAADAGGGGANKGGESDGEGVHYGS